MDLQLNKSLIIKTIMSVSYYYNRKKQAFPLTSVICAPFLSCVHPSK
jgi:hypothetical protein